MLTTKQDDVTVLTRAQRKAAKRLAKQQSQEKPAINGDVKSGPAEKQGHDHVAAKLSWYDLGLKDGEIIGYAETAFRSKLAEGTITIRQHIIAVLDTPPESWASYSEGMGEVITTLKKNSQPHKSLEVTRSRVNRCFRAAETQYEKTVNLLKDEKLSFEKVLDALPKRATGKPKATSAVAASVTAPPEGMGAQEISKEVSAGALLQIINAAANRLEELGKGKDAAFAWFIGKNIREFVDVAVADFERIRSKHETGGIVKDKSAYYAELGLIEKAVA